ncbi:hypothetical protein ACP3S8_14745 [Mixta calida]|jgi:hypothetical protein|uniref:Uncharacterized protein n=1 Tax=Mixta calida TaxID=665913 RepID=A0ABM6S409_9GAMM|nr:hypothetical protein PSNIH2_01280 [Pantoea sp. PSNIH2]AUY26564.1 hypothetical protein C2E16_17745 [Mixta calida]KAF0860171.1 hypothetical protein Y888_07680 [Mixta calida B021323]POU52244.1 hypothetical protein C3380_01415 [Pantoea sp. PSNIH5]POU69742.1 hypothetical protein C3374_04650 [Pantoea sp. PSNIH4]POY69835.1 hypothetical protein C3402_01420 [Pantoea sp. PSNIH3]
MIPHVAAGGSAPQGDLFGEDSTLSDATMSQISHRPTRCFNPAVLCLFTAHFVAIIALYAKVL